MAERHNAFPLDFAHLRTSASRYWPTFLGIHIIIEPLHYPSRFLESYKVECLRRQLKPQISF